ncbi:hypothetical protein [Sciscionella sediminilitoris]|uniref:hypothetical protein n=1 Tax=Sciscionella sediminilitoris TaxID=1445613 RepID=UPI0012E1F81B|nr:hypothetical protein [Sciscionella sp. SE31]
MTEPSTPETPRPPAEFTDDTPTPPSGLSIEARQWQQDDQEDVRELDFNQFRTDR